MAEGAGSSQCPWDLCEVRKHVGGMSRKEESQQHANSRTLILQKQTAVENKKNSLTLFVPEILKSHLVPPEQPGTGDLCEQLWKMASVVQADLSQKQCVRVTGS